MLYMHKGLGLVLQKHTQNNRLQGRWGHIGLEWLLAQWLVSYKKREIWTDTQRRKSCECRGREAWSGFSLRASRRTQPCLHLDLRFLALTTLFFLSYQVCNDFFQQPQELIHSKMCQGPTGAWCGLMFLLQVTAGATRKRAEPGLPVEMLSS
jgi:hypothetical protein